MIKIEVEILKKIIENFFDKLERENTKHFYFEDKYYWSISEKEFTNMTEHPKCLVGSFEDDIDFLNLIIKEEVDLDYLELEGLSAILKYLSGKLTR